MRWSANFLSVGVVLAVVVGVGAACVPSPGSEVPVISGEVVVGGTLTASRGSWEFGPTRHAYMWWSCDSADKSNCRRASVGSDRFVPTLGDLGRFVFVEVAAGNDAGTASQRSALVGPVGSTKLTATAVTSTSSPSVVVSGSGVPGDTVRVLNGQAPAAVQVDAAGQFVVEVPLRLGQVNDLDVVNVWGALVAVRVEQTDAAGERVVEGRIVDENGNPVPSAIVSAGSVTTTSSETGEFRLIGLPVGLLGIVARAEGHLGGASTVDTAGVDPGSGSIRVDLLLQRLADPVTVGPDGVELEGVGYRVVVPPGAVAQPTPIQVTQLVFSGAKDLLGAPIVDLSPEGTALEQPVKVELDPGVLGVAPDYVAVVGLNPDTGEAQVLPSRIEGGLVVVELSRFDGIELRTLVQEGAFGEKCTPYEPWEKLAGWAGWIATGGTFPGYVRDPELVQEYLQVVLTKALGSRMGRDSEILWSEYLEGGTPDLTRRGFTDDGLRQFRQSAQTEQARTSVMDELRFNLLKTPPDLPPLEPPEDPAERQLSWFYVSGNSGVRIGQDLDINYNDVFSVPGNTAGGSHSPDGTNSQSSPALGSRSDWRSIEGAVRFVPEVDAQGVLTSVGAVVAPSLRVLDSIDLCPGDAGSPLEAFATIPMSRLEVTKRGQGNATWAKPILIEAGTELDGEVIDVTRQYDNDGDGDGVPDHQPWESATYVLDNCPGIYNPDQTAVPGSGCTPGSGDPNLIEGTVDCSTSTATTINFDQPVDRLQLSLSGQWTRDRHLTVDAMGPGGFSRQHSYLALGSYWGGYGPVTDVALTSQPGLSAVSSFTIGWGFYHGTGTCLVRYTYPRGSHSDPVDVACAADQWAVLEIPEGQASQLEARLTLSADKLVNVVWYRQDGTQISKSLNLIGPMENAVSSWRAPADAASVQFRLSARGTDVTRFCQLQVVPIEE